ncbi:protein of unknown function [Pararobbsia alpina]|uniref:DUF3005 domain-containing protein n=1 Tax=Pararobbsia alpina TaxID=621374 RepID=UPI0039A4ACF7
MDQDKKDSARANPTQGQQSAASGQSPAKEPAHETAHADPGKMAKSFANTSPEGHHPSAKKTETQRVARSASPLPPVDISLKAVDHPDHFEAARSRIVSVDTAGTQASDSTVDTDGKSREALRERKPRQDHFVHSNASPDEHVPTSPVGLGGIDSRLEGPGVRIATKPGWHVVDLGTTVRTDMNGMHASRHIRIERDDTSEKAPLATEDLTHK